MENTFYIYASLTTTPASGGRQQSKCHDNLYRRINFSIIRGVTEVRRNWVVSISNILSIRLPFFRDKSISGTGQSRKKG